MGRTGWRKAFCTSIRRDSDANHYFHHQQQQEEDETPSPTPRSCAKLSFFGPGAGRNSNPSAPRLKTTKEDNTAAQPKLHCKISTTKAADLARETAAPRPFTPPAARTSKSPRFLFRAGASNPSSPISPSRFALFKASLGFTKNRCGICLQSVKREGLQAVFTAECYHSFHLPCIAAHTSAVRSDRHPEQEPPSTIACPVCSTQWRQTPFLNALSTNPQQQHRHSIPAHHAQVGASGGEHGGQRGSTSSKRYDDDEPLHHSTATMAAGAIFNPIPEAEENDDNTAKQREEEGTPTFPGFFIDGNSGTLEPATACSYSRHASFNSRPAGIKVEVAPVSALVSIGRRHQNHVISIKVKAPPPPPRTAAAPLLNPSHRAPIDLVTVLDVGGNMTAAKLHMLKRAMRLLISSFGPADRLAVVAFSSSAAKRLVPLRRMSPHGRRSARHVVDRLVVCRGEGSCIAEALKKATKILEDRRERNPVATIMLLSDAPAQQTPSCAAPPTSAASAPATRFAHLELPINESGFGSEEYRLKNNSKQGGDDHEDAFAKCVGGLLSVVVQDLHLHLTLPSGEILAVYTTGSGCGRNLSPSGSEGSSICVGDLYAEEERELVVEIRVPTGSQSIAPVFISVKCSYRDPATQEVVRCQPTPLPMPRLVDHSGGERLRGLFVTTRALTESRRLSELNDVSTAVRLLSSARSLLLHYHSVDKNMVHSLEAELADLQWRQSQRRRVVEQQQQPARAGLVAVAGGGGEDVLTPTSAWRAAERLAKVAIMRKSMNRVSDLHGFENARF